MSDPMTDGPTEEQMRAYLESLRDAQPVEIVVQSFGILATASEVKLGRDDARVLIDGMAALLEATASRMQPEIVERMRETVSQLQMAQVQAERDAGRQPAGDPSQASDAVTPPQPVGDASASGDTAQPERDVASRLWIPGRD